MDQNKKIIIVCGYQKSGTTWATRLIAQLLDAPSAGYWGYEGRTFVVEGKERDSELVCYQSHHMLNNLVNTESNKLHKLIYIVRDPRDIVVSGIFHFSFYSSWVEKVIIKDRLPSKAISLLKVVNSKSHSIKYKTKRMIMMLKQGDGFIDHCNWAWNEHVLPYLNNKEVLVVKYEDLLLKGPSTAKTILNYIGLEKSEDKILNDLASHSFNVKKKEFKEQGNKVKVKHMRKGVVGDWKNQLSDQYVAIIINNHGEIMDTLGYI